MPDEDKTFSFSIWEFDDVSLTHSILTGSLVTVKWLEKNQGPTPGVLEVSIL